MRKLLLIVFTIVMSFKLSAQNISGSWSGTLKVQSQSLDLIFDILENSDETFSSTLSVPVQSLKGFKMDSTIFKNGGLRIVSTRLGLKYEGLYIMKTFIGKYSQGGMSFDLTLAPAKAQEIKRPQTPKAPFNYRSENVTFTNEKDGNKLAGTLTLPLGNGPFPAVVLVSGSGQQNRDSELFNHKPFWVLADYLSSRGIAVLRYDDRGEGESERAYVFYNSENLALDAEAAMKLLRQRNDISSVGIVGHSEGGMIAFMLSSGRLSKNVPDFVVSMAGAGLPGVEVLKGQARAIMQAQGTPSEQVEKAVGINSGAFDIILNSDAGSEDVWNELKAYFSKVYAGGMDEKGLDAVVNTVYNSWMSYFIKYDPSVDISKCAVPALAINGSKDLQVLADENLAGIQAAFTDKSLLTIKKFDGLNHLFQHADKGLPEEYFTIEETISPEVLSFICEWVLSLGTK